MQVAPIDGSVYDDDANQGTSATSIVIKDTVPLIDEPQSKWFCLCRSVDCYHSLPYFIICYY